eukprot:TRINITY_DN1438_c0_g1_i3.p1 TRINITY_DN1438_c0_g1~~TRINITY_DN1438_c0_g1_i3.p1  ORF type:complete len:256 (-),score=32.02 TRINITY_DN1438_c0_g1_i3:167-934(-)
MARHGQRTLNSSPVLICFSRKPLARITTKTDERTGTVAFVSATNPYRGANRRAKSNGSICNKSNQSLQGVHSTWGLTQVMSCANRGGCSTRFYVDVQNAEGVDSNATKQLMGAGGICIFLLVLALLGSIVGCVVNAMAGLGVVTSIPKLPERFKLGLLKAAPWFAVGVLALTALTLLFWIAIFPYKAVLDSANGANQTVTQGAGAAFALQIISLILLIGSVVVDRIPRLQPSHSLPADTSAAPTNNAPNPVTQAV